MALTTLVKVKEYAGDISDTSDDALLTRLIDSVTKDIEQYCSRTMASASYTDTMDGNGGRKMPLLQFPITAVVGVTINGQSIPVRTSPTSFGFTFSDSQVHLTGYTFDYGIDNVSIDYTAGYSTIPADLEQACIETVLLRYKSRDRVGITDKTLSGQRISFEGRSFSESVMNVLDNYKAVW